MHARNTDPEQPNTASIMMLNRVDHNEIPVNNLSVIYTKCDFRIRHGQF